MNEEAKTVVDAVAVSGTVATMAGWLHIPPCLCVNDSLVIDPYLRVGYSATDNWTWKSTTTQI